MAFSCILSTDTWDCFSVSDFSATLQQDSWIVETADWNTENLRYQQNSAQLVQEQFMINRWENRLLARNMDCLTHSSTHCQWAWNKGISNVRMGRTIPIFRWLETHTWNWTINRTRGARQHSHQMSLQFSRPCPSSSGFIVQWLTNVTYFMTPWPIAMP